MAVQLKLLEPQHKLIWGRRKAIQERFKVQIESPFACTEFQDPEETWMYKGFGGKDMFFVAIKGETCDLVALEKYVEEVFLNPEIIEIFSYHQDLEPIFGNTLWTRIVEEIHDVCISQCAACELNVAGTDSSVKSAVSSMQEVTVKYSECQDKLVTNNEGSLAQKLVSALRACKNIVVSASTYSLFPNAVITVLLSLLQKATNEEFPTDDDLSQLDESVVIIDPPEEKKEIPLVDLSSGSEDDSNDKPPKSCKSCATQKMSKKKRRKALKAELNSKKRQLGLCDLDPQSGDIDWRKIPANQYPKVGSSTTHKGKQPIIENPDFISLSLGGTSNFSSQQAPVQQNNPCHSEAEAQPREAEVVPQVPRRLRPVVIDGSNVAFHFSSQGRWSDFSWKLIQKSVQYFLDRGHTDVKVFLPRHRLGVCYEKSENRAHIDNLESQGLLVFTPSRKIDGKTVACYDDRFIVDYAFRTGGVILSNDNYRDLMNENEQWATTIKQRLLMYVFAGDELMIPDDPLGPRGPKLDDFLAFPPDPPQ